MSAWPVVLQDDNGIRLAGKPDQCFYCRASVGEPHGRECVVILKRVRLRYTFEVEVEVPHFWTEDNILFHRNDSSWCANNALNELERDEDEPCLCNDFTAEFLAVVDDTPRRPR